MTSSDMPSFPEVLRPLLRGLVDYAGLFPPAGLDMAAAVAAYAVENRGADAWILGRFVVPVGRLDAFAEAARDRLPSGTGRGGAPWPLSVLAGADPEAEREAIDAFNVAHASYCAVESVEIKAATEEEVTRRCPAFLRGGALEVYVELPHDEDPSALLAALAAQKVDGMPGARAKIRTGGITPELFPTPAEVARFVAAAARAGVPFKATAGLHHPLRGEYRLTYEDDSPSGVMFGFLNVFLAAAVARLHPDADLETLLGLRDVAALELDEDGLRFGGHRLDPASLEATRRFATSYGSCSFREPVDELRSLLRLA